MKGIILGSIIGMLMMAVAQGIAGYFMDGNKMGGGSWLSLNDPRLFLLIEAFLGGAAGLLIGGVAGGFGLSFPKSLLLSFGLSLIASFVLMRSTETAPFYSYSIGYTTVCYLILGSLCGTLVSRLFRTASPEISPATFAPFRHYSVPSGKAEFVWRIPFWQWFVIVPVLLWTLILALYLIN